MCVCKRKHHPFEKWWVSINQIYCITDYQIFPKYICVLGGMLLLLLKIVIIIYNIYFTRYELVMKVEIFGIFTSSKVIMKMLSDMPNLHRPRFIFPLLKHLLLHVGGRKKLETTSTLCTSKSFFFFFFFFF